MAYFIKKILLPEGWKSNVRLVVSRDGHIESIDPDGDAGDAEVIEGPVIPGMPNLHSHAFQRIMAGLTEYATTGENNFWSWRSTMYGFANRISPEQYRPLPHSSTWRCSGPVTPRWRNSTTSTMTTMVSLSLIMRR